MEITVNLNDLMQYTDWERQKWHNWLGKHAPGTLTLTPGPNGDGRFQTIGDLLKHIFSAEKRYIDRLSGRALTDAPSLPIDDIDGLFSFGQQSRKDLREFVATFPAEQWDVPQDHKLMSSVLTVTPRKIVVHVLLHEIRHWAQIATLFRLNGLSDDFHDFLFSPVMGGQIRREQPST